MLSKNKASCSTTWHMCPRKSCRNEFKYNVELLHGQPQGIQLFSYTLTTITLPFKFELRIFLLNQTTVYPIIYSYIGGKNRCIYNFPNATDVRYEQPQLESEHGSPNSFSKMRPQKQMHRKNGHHYLRHNEWWMCLTFVEI